MLSVLKRIKLLLLVSILLFGIEENYCSEEQLAPPVSGEQNNAHENLQAQELGSRGKFIQGYIYYEVFTNILYWLFDWYQKKRGWYFYKYYYCVGYMTRLYHKIFYLDIYLRFFILRLVCPVISFFVVLLRNKSCPDFTDERVYVSAFLCIFPEIDLNIRLWKKFYLVIGFKDIFAMSLYSKFIKLLF